MIINVCSVQEQSRLTSYKLPQHVPKSRRPLAVTEELASPADGDVSREKRLGADLTQTS